MSKASPSQTPLSDAPATDKVFVLGDSNTGTLTLHNFFVQNGLKSTHYYMEKSGQKTPLHEFPIENERNFLRFVDESPLQCFCDYPTRFYFRQLAERFPSARFILTTRDSVERWIGGMVKLSGKLDRSIDLERAKRNYLDINEQIVTLMRSRASRFLELCMDEGPLENTGKLADFLGLPNPIPLPPHEVDNPSDNELISERHRLYHFLGDRTIEAIERSVAPTRAVLSEFGWIFLGNDTNDFLRVQFGQKKWTGENRAAAARTIRDRVDTLGQTGAAYRKFIVPEKSVVYREYLPRALARLEPATERPAQQMAQDCNGVVHYLSDYLRDARSYGQLYFRGDTHTNWTGAWFVYLSIVNALIADGLIPPEPLSFSDLQATVAGYEGDLTVMVDPDRRKAFDGYWAVAKPSYGFEIAFKLVLSDNARLARRVANPDHYATWYPTRETLAYEREDGRGLRAVVFRDSTLDLCHELIAQHFSRSVFVWHHGLVHENILREEKPDIVLHIMAERFVVRYPDFPVIVPAT